MPDVKPSTRAAVTRAVVAGHETAQQIADTTGLQVVTVRAALEVLVREGTVERTKRTGGQPWLHRPAT